MRRFWFVVLTVIGCGNGFQDALFTGPPGGGGGAAGAGGASSSAVSSADGAAASSSSGTPVVPEGWTLLYKDSSCGAPTVRYKDPQKAACTPCSCGDIEGAYCSPILCNFGSGTGSCSGSEGCGNADKVGCFDVGGLGSGLGWKLETATMVDVTTAKCVAMGGQPTPAAAFATTIQLCAAGAGPSCVERAGDVAACPMGWPSRQLVFGGSNDGRTCAKCNCTLPDPATLKTCTAPKVSLFTGANCTGTEAPLSSSCTSGTGFKALKVIEAPKVNGSCTPSGGAASGEVKPSDPYTICCAN